MCKKTVFLTILFGLFLVVAAQAQAADKFAYVDLNKIFTEYNKTKDYDKSLGDKENIYTAEREKKINELKGFQDKISLLNDKEKEAKKGELETKARAFEESDRQKQADLRKEQDERMKEILKDIEDAVKKHALAEGITLVFNDRVLVYEDKALDITNKIIAILNSPDTNKGQKK